MRHLISPINTVAELNTFGAVIVNSFYYMTLHQASSVESVLILFSSFPKDVILPPSPKLTGMANTRAVTDEIIVTGFGDIQTAVLALVWCDYAQYETGFVLYDQPLPNAERFLED